MHGRIPFVSTEIVADSVDLGTIIDFFVRWWRFVLGISAVVLSVTVFALFTMTPQYTATTQVLLDPRKSNAAGVESILPELSLESSAVESQLTVIQSRALLRRVVERHKLADDDEFGSRAKPGVVTALKRLVFGEPRQTTGDADELIPPDVLRAIEALRRNLEVTRVGRTYVLSISVTSESPEKASRLANAVADAYVVDQLEARYDAAKRASAWLSERLETLQGQLRQSEEAVERFRADHNLVGTHTGTVSEQQLSEINAKLAAARAETAEKRAKYEQAGRIAEERGNLQSIPDVLRSPVISNLRTQQADVARREADLIARYGDRHPMVVNVRAERRDMERLIGAEVQRIVDNLKNDYEVASSREDSLEDSLKQLTGQTGTDNKSAVRLRELERVAAANRALYESFLSRAKVTEQQATLESRESRIISPATRPQAPSSPKKALITALAVVMGLGLGIGGAFVLELLNAGFTTPRQVEDLLDLPVFASVTKLSDAELRIDGEKHRPPDYLVKKPLSRYSEAVRSIRAGVQMSDVDHPPKVIQLTSALPNEGKSTLAISFALSAAEAGAKVILVDCDLRHPSSSKFFELEDKPGLVDLLTDALPDRDAIVRGKGNRIDVLGAGKRSQNPPDLLSSARMQSLLDRLRSTYDCVILDSPPVTPVIDAVILSKSVDKVLFVTKWGSTPREAVAQAAKQIPGDRKIAGVALNMLDERRAPRYGRHSYYGGGYYKKYYASYYSE